MDLDKLYLEHACQNKCAGWSKSPHDAFGLLNQQVGSEVGADHVEFHANPKWHEDEVLPKDADPSRHAILNCIRACHANGSGVEVKGLDRLVTQLGRCDGKNSGTGADVQERGWLSGGSSDC